MQDKDKPRAQLIEELEALRQRTATLEAAESERKRTEEALQQSEQNYRMLVNNIHDGVFVIQDGKMQFVNETFATMVGCAVEEVIGLGFQDLVAPEDLEMVTERYRRRQAGENVPGEYEFRMLHKDKVTRVIVEMNVVLMTYRGRVASMGTLKDITVKKELERQRADFLAMLTHDIKNPLGAILGYTEILLEEAEEAGLNEKKELLQGLKSNAFTIHSLVSNYLDLSTIEAGRLTLMKTPVGLNNCCVRWDNSTKPRPGVDTSPWSSSSGKSCLRLRETVWPWSGSLPTW